MRFQNQGNESVALRKLAVLLNATAHTSFL
jgi:hypothetical protein